MEDVDGHVRSPASRDDRSDGRALGSGGHHCSTGPSAGTEVAGDEMGCVWAVAEPCGGALESGGE